MFRYYFFVSDCVHLSVLSARQIFSYRIVSYYEVLTCLFLPLLICIENININNCEFKTEWLWAARWIARLSDLMTFSVDIISHTTRIKIPRTVQCVVLGSACWPVILSSPRLSQSILFIVRTPVLPLRQFRVRHSVCLASRVAMATPGCHRHTCKQSIQVR